MAVEGPALSDIERLRRLQAVTDAALAHLSVDELLSELLDRIRSALEADTCAFLLLDPNRNELVARAAKGIEEEVERGVRIPVGKGFAGRIAAERQTVALDDVDHADVLNPLLRERGIKSLLGAPLIARERVMGVVHVGTLSPSAFQGGGRRAPPTGRGARRARPRAQPPPRGAVEPRCDEAGVRRHGGT